MIRVDWWERGLGSGLVKEMKGGAQREHKRSLHSEKTALEGNRPIGQNNKLREKQRNQVLQIPVWLSLLQLEGYLELKRSICVIWALVTAENIIA